MIAMQARAKAGVPNPIYDVPAKLAKIDAVIETRGPDHVDEIIAALRAAYFQVRQLDDSAS